MTGNTFEDAIEKLIPKHLNLLKVMGVRDPGNYFHIDYYRKTIMLFYPLKDNLIYPVVFHISERKHYTPPSKVYNKERESGHFYSMVRAFFKHIRKRGVKVKERYIYDRTFFLVCSSYTKSVRGGQRKTYSGISVRVHVIKRFSDIAEAIKKAWNVVYNYLSKRLNKLNEALRKKGVKPFGPVEKFQKNLTVICEFIGLSLI